MASLNAKIVSAMPMVLRAPNVMKMENVLVNPISQETNVTKVSQDIMTSLIPSPVSAMVKDLLTKTVMKKVENVPALNMLLVINVINVQLDSLGSLNAKPVDVVKMDLWINLVMKMDSVLARNMSLVTNVMLV